MDNKLREIEEELSKAIEEVEKANTLRLETIDNFNKIKREYFDNKKLVVKQADTIKRLQIESDNRGEAVKELFTQKEQHISTIKRLTEERDAYKRGYYHDADGITLTVLEIFEKRNIELNSLLRQKEEEIQSLNKRYLEEFEKKHD